MSAAPDLTTDPTAPLYAAAADGPDGGQATWLMAEDGVRIRVVSWATDAPKGTVLLFPGRTEYCEKYGRTARDLARRGYATLTVDWRGQGLADRLLDHSGIGHVGKFTDYQKDVAALLAHAEASALPRPFYLIAHSMGGAIGLRALIEGLPVEACAFTGPMWGIGLSPILRPVAIGVGAISKALGMANRIAPGQSSNTYVSREPFEGNTLTNDPEMFGWMKGQISAHPELALGGPSIHWLNEALAECKTLDTRRSPELPCLTFLGTQEDIVDTDRIHDRMRRWPGGDLVIVPACQHEVLMEGEAIRSMAMDKLEALFTPSKA